MSRTSPAVDGHLVDEALSRYIQWREACAAVGDAYDHWKRAPRRERPMSFAAYWAALDHEESTARMYGTAMSRIAS